MKYTVALFTGVAVFLFSCNKNDSGTPSPEIFSVKTFSVNGITTPPFYNTGYTPVIKLSFSAPVDRSIVANNVVLLMNGTSLVPVNYNYQNGDSDILIQPQASLNAITRYIVSVSGNFKSSNNTPVQSAYNSNFFTKIDSAPKFPLLTDNQLLDTVQRYTFRYFWEFGHPVSGMARERNTSGDLVTSGGTGFGIMAIIAAVNRNFITRQEGRDRMLKITNFLLDKCTRYHGAFAHWINGATGVTIPFSQNDDGADLVETSYLMAGLLTARQCFNGTDAIETGLRNNINSLWNGVEWDWFRNGGQDVLYWHWSSDKGWIMNHQIRGWNECLITYILAASSTTHSTTPQVYSSGWAGGNPFINGASYYGYQLPLGPALGGPLFFAQYSFLGVDPNGLQDAYANYTTQTTNHTMINYSYCSANPRNYFGYSQDCWGLTASDIQGGYTASSPTNDVGVIAPTAALSSFPYTPAESMNTLKFFYYILGDKIWRQYGFVDAFALKDTWFANSFLAIDQGPIIIMIENYRSGLIWDLLTSCPEIKTGMRNLGFIAPYL